jgi:hypothetical protein
MIAVRKAEGIIRGMIRKGQTIEPGNRVRR